MNVITAIETRRAIKQFDAGHKMTEREIEALLSLALLSPTAFNLQHWRFVLLQSPELRDAIRAVSWMQPQITDASLVVVICADLRAWEKDPGRYWSAAPDDVREGAVAAIDEYYRGRPQTQRDEAMRSCGIAAQTLMLAAKEMGYDSCPMDLSDFDEVAKLIRLPEDHVVAMFVAIGKRVREPWPRAGQLPMAEVVRVDHF
ncbi:MAG: nitroreductase family protein [Thiobacillus sp.]|uniref:nitroreductase family protein n=1 Tax=Thiobacillus sp. TaxID=924 RepID=UPI0028957442|nr:nitroreductase family protein [Thiobacillus sp.]MDT3707881.1 nitroreductase family protein [Thiobacillus sp.]